MTGAAIQRLREATARALDAFDDYTAAGQSPTKWTEVYESMKALDIAFNSQTQKEIADDRAWVQRAASRRKGGER